MFWQTKRIAEMISRHWSAVFRQDDAAELRYLERVAEAWQNMNRAGFVNVLHGGGKFALQVAKAPAPAARKPRANVINLRKPRP
jgi:isopentenyl phosphate kinase